MTCSPLGGDGEIRIQVNLDAYFYTLCYVGDCGSAAQPSLQEARDSVGFMSKRKDALGSLGLG